MNSSPSLFLWEEEARKGRKQEEEGRDERKGRGGHWKEQHGRERKEGRRMLWTGEVRYCNTCEGVEQYFDVERGEWMAPYVDGAVYCDCELPLVPFQLPMKTFFNIGVDVLSEA